MNLTKANEDYLEAILILEENEKIVRSIDIARMLNVSRPGVNQAMNVLKDLKLIIKDDYSDIKLTDEGRKIAKKVYEKHIVIKDFLLHIGVSNETAENDCCKIEHVLSEETFNCLKNFLIKK